MTRKQYDEHVLKLLTRLEREEDHVGIREAIMSHRKYRLDGSYDCGCVDVDCSRNYLRR